MKKGVNVYSVKNNWHIDQNMQRETATMVFAMALEIDRDLSSKRTKEALRAKKASGASLGRPKGPGKSKLDPFRAEIKTLLKNGSTKAFIANRYKTTPANLSNWMKKHGITRSNSKGECEETNHSP
jgi:DNA invertase Pin-like site-specific DNA recombinase